MEFNQDASALSVEDILGAREQQGSESTEQQQPTETEETTTEDEVSAVSTETEGEILDVVDSEETNTEESESEEEVEADVFDIVENQEQTNEDNLVNEESSGTNTNDFSEILGGQFDNGEELNEYVEGLESELQTIRESSSTPEFANEYIEKMNQYVLNGGSAADFARVQGVDVNTMNPIDILTTELMWNNPGISKSDAQSYIEDKYEAAMDDDGNINMSNVQLKIDANSASKAIKDIQAEDAKVEQKPVGVSESEWTERQSTMNEETKEEAYQQDVERMTGWMKPVEDSVNGLVQKGLIVKLSDTKAFRFNHTQDESYANELVERVDKALYDAGVSIHGNEDLAQQMTENIFWLDNKDSIIKEAGIRMANSVNEQWFKDIHNPSVISRGDSSPNSQSKESTAFESIMKMTHQ